MDLQFTAVFREVPEGYIAFVEELPGANTQGATLDEARANLREAVAMVLEANRELAEHATGGGPVIREPLKVSAFPSPSSEAYRIGFDPHGSNGTSRSRTQAPCG
jgi:predicted RNase H-like HicB family nuclease